MHLSCFQLYQIPFNCPWRYQQATQFDLISSGTIGVLLSNAADSDSHLLRQGSMVWKKKKRKKRTWTWKACSGCQLKSHQMAFALFLLFSEVCCFFFHPSLRCYISIAVSPPPTLPSSLLHIPSTLVHSSCLLLQKKGPPRDGRHN